MSANTTISPPGSDTDSELLESAEMSEEDKQEILQEIDKLVERNKIPVTDDLFKLKPRKKGGVFPLVLNLVMLLLVGGGVYFAFRYFDDRQENLSLETEQYFSTEGKLIEELKKESEIKLRKKDEEIQKIQNEIVELDRQSAALRENMEEQIRSREEQLRQTLEAELETERQRLQALGQSREEIDQQLQVLEAQRQAEFEQELTLFREESQAKLQAKEEELIQAKALTQEILDKANKEKRELAEETRQREEELRQQFEAETEALRTQTTKAEERLQQLSRLREQEQLVADQIVGSFNTIIDKIENGDIPGAGADLSKLETLLKDGNISNLTSIAKRRDIDLFLIDMVRENIAATAATASTETTSLVQAANMVLSVREIVARGEAARTKGNLVDAERLFDRAIREIPSITTAYSGLNVIQEQQEAARVNAFLEEGDSYLATGDLENAVNRYQEAAVEPAGTNGELVRQALNGIQRSLGVREDGRIAVVNQEIDRLEEEISRGEQTIREREDKIDELNSDIESLYQDIEDLEDEIVALNRSIGVGEEEIADLNQKIRLKEAEIVQITEEKRSLESSLEDLASRFVQARRRAERLLDSEDPDNHNRAKKVLVDIFELPQAKRLFPGIGEILENIDIAVIADEREDASAMGRESALKDILRFVDYLAGLTPAGRDEARIDIVNQVKDDLLFKTTIEGIQDLAVSGGAEVERQVLRAREKLLGTVSSVTSGKVIIERLVNIEVNPGDTVIIKRKSPLAGEVILAEGEVLEVKGGRISARIDRVSSVDQPPAIMDLVYVAVPE